MINRRRFETAVFTALRDHIRCGNLAISGSKRFGKLEDFFINKNRWDTVRGEFFQKNQLPQAPKEVPIYLENRLNNAFKYFLERETSNTFAKIGKEGWELSKDPAGEFSAAKKQKLEALAEVVNGIGGIEATKAWGDGKTANADGQRFGYRRKTLQRSFSHKFNDFAIEFYIFVADNYAPFYNLVKEVTDRDSSKVLDGYLYNVS